MKKTISGSGSEGGSDEFDAALRRLLDEIETGLAGLSETQAGLAAEALRRSIGLQGRPTLPPRTWAVPPDPSALKSRLGDLPQTAYFDAPEFFFPPERLMQRHADLSSRQFPALSDFVATKSGDETLRICIVTYEFDGPTRASGTAIEMRCLAEQLQKDGHEVSVLYMREGNCDAGSVREWVSFFQERGIEFIPLPRPEIPSPSGHLASSVARSRAAYEWLKTRSFDLIHAPDEKGGAFVSLAAKRLGLAFADTIFIVAAGAPTLWRCRNESSPISSLGTLATIHMERKCVEDADAVIGSSRHILRWMMRNGYDLPNGGCFVQPPLAASLVLAKSHRPFDKRQVARPIAEIVYVDAGDAASRSGAEMFTRALSMADVGHAGIAVTFLRLPSTGSPAGKGLASDQYRGKGSSRVLDVRDMAEAITYLAGAGRLSVLLSFAEARPSVLFGCLAAGIPFVISDLGGAPELVHAEDRPAVVCERRPAALAARFRSILREGAIIVRPSFDPQQTIDGWLDSYRTFREPETRRRLGEARMTWNGLAPRRRAVGDEPLVSVCIVHFNRPDELASAIESIRRQTHRNIELIVVDDGSSLPEARSYLDRLEAEWAATNEGRVVRQSNSYPGAARNRGVQNSTGEFILFMDDDNLAKPDEITTFLRAADHSGADILTCYSDTFRGKSFSGAVDKYIERFTPVGDAVSLGLFCNCFGDSNAFIRRRIFDALGGFTEDYGVGLEDYEFFLRAVMRGFKLVVIPEALYWYRISDSRIRERHLDRFSERIRVLNAFLDNTPLCIYPALQFARDTIDGAPASLAGRQRTASGIAGAVRRRIDAAVIKASGLFDVDYYLKMHSDVAHSGVNPLMHFIRYGVYEGRKPNPWFDPTAYMDDFPEIAAGGINPLIHYLRSGGAPVHGIARLLLGISRSRA